MSKEKFRLENYQSIEAAMHTPEKWQAEIFFEYLRKNEQCWCDGEMYDKNNTYWDDHGKYTAYDFSSGHFGDTESFLGMRVLSFDDYDWSDYGIKELTKSDISLDELLL